VVLDGRNRHAAPGAHSRASLSVSRSVAHPAPVIFIEVLTKCQYRLKLKRALRE
jgi:hypothetical protein